ncbi:3-deoxy-manno-octulosonate cytidylyltransferase [Halothiobacillus sp. DCM-1]|uniref:3-deoxy-manno-octulosonate cytidylyltransferase n=1 Tax=Halothiobacillus sp. DCM-1 TaxID=3112558 RepID=UPI0032493C5D
MQVEPLAFEVIIPARMGSSRLPGKPLADIHGRPMIAWVYDCAKASGALRVQIACDHPEIAAAAAACGATAIITRADHPSGTDRLAEVIEQTGLPDEAVIVNLQGDEPLMVPALLKQVASLLIAHPASAMATLMVPITDPAEFADPAVVKVVVGGGQRALYFSRAAIPHDRDAQCPPGSVLGYRHLGLYAYRAGFIRRFVATPVAELEAREKLEQLRALAMGETIVIAEAAAIPPAGVDTPEDLARVRAVLAQGASCGSGLA